MTEYPFDQLLDNTPYEQLSEGMLMHLAAQGDEAAEKELQRRAQIMVIGPEIEDDSPIEDRSDEVLLKQIAAGNKEASIEYMRRHTVPIDDARTAVGREPLEK